MVIYKGNFYTTTYTECLVRGSVEIRKCFLILVRDYGFFGFFDAEVSFTGDGLFFSFGFRIVRIVLLVSWFLRRYGRLL